MMFKNKKIDVFYKAKEINTKEWIYGYFTKKEGKDYILSDSLNGEVIWHEIKPETLCICTGLKDFYDDWLYSGDIIQKGIDKSEIWFEDACFWIKFSHRFGISRQVLHSIFYDEETDWILCGNIFDEPPTTESEDK